MTNTPRTTNKPWENADGSTNVDGFIEAFAKDDNTFWRASSGHHMNIIEELIERNATERTARLEAEETLKKLKNGLRNNNTDFEIAFLDAYLENFKTLRLQLTLAQKERDEARNEVERLKEQLTDSWSALSAVRDSSQKEIEGLRKENEFMHEEVYKDAVAEGIHERLNAAEKERDEAKQGMAWLVQMLIDKVNATDDKEGWIQRAIEAGKFRDSEIRRLEKERNEAVVELRKAGEALKLVRHHVWMPTVEVANAVSEALSLSLMKKVLSDEAKGNIK